MKAAEYFPTAGKLWVPATRSIESFDRPSSARDDGHMRDRSFRPSLLSTLIVIAVVLLRPFIVRGLRLLIRRVGLSEVLILAGIDIRVPLVGAVWSHPRGRILLHRKIANNLLMQVELARQPRLKLEEERLVDDEKETQQP